MKEKSSGTRALMSWVAILVGAPLSSACDSPTSQGIDLDGGEEVIVGPDGAVIHPGDDTVLPGGYVAANECGNLGNTCQTGKPCGPGLTCEGSVCLPDPIYQSVDDCRLNGCPQEAPICLQGVCLTPDELGCVCLDRQGREKAHQCASLLPDASSECLFEESVCDGRPDGCCPGLACMQGKGPDGRQFLGICMKPCATDDECDSHCCGDNERVASTFCGTTFESCSNACRRLDEECDVGRNPCCQGLVCTQGAQDIGLNGCQIPCHDSGECQETGCCLLFTNADGSKEDNGICAPADRCQ